MRTPGLPSESVSRYRGEFGDFQFIFSSAIYYYMQGYQQNIYSSERAGTPIY